MVGTYSIYADAGTEDDGVTVLAGVGRLTQTMRQYARDNLIDVTLQDITAIKQTQKSDTFSFNDRNDAYIEGSKTLDSTNRHFKKNAVVDYGLHDVDNGGVYKPFFVTDTGFARARVKQISQADLDRYVGDGQNTIANRDNLGDTDLTNLFSLLNVVVVTDRNDQPNKPATGQLTIKKQLTGENLSSEDYAQFFKFQVELCDSDGTPLSEYQYYFYGDDWVGDIKDGNENSVLMLRHGEAVTILGLPAGTKFTVTEIDHNGWYVDPDAHEGVIVADENFFAIFTNKKDPKKPKIGRAHV